MNQNTAQAKPSRTYKSKITLPRQSLNTQKQRTKHQTQTHIHFWLNGKHRRSQSSNCMKLPSFYHTIVHDNDSVNEMPKSTAKCHCCPAPRHLFAVAVGCGAGRGGVAEWSLRKLCGVMGNGRSIAAQTPGWTTAAWHCAAAACAKRARCNQHGPVQSAPPIHTWLQKQKASKLPDGNTLQSKINKFNTNINKNKRQTKHWNLFEQIQQETY